MTESVEGMPTIRDDLAQQVLAAIDPQETIDFLRGLVQIPSVNPPGDTRDGVAYCQRKLDEAGFATRILAADPEKPNLIATYGQSSGPTLCFNAHIDVVPTGDVGAWTHPPFYAALVDGKVYGRGAGDDKASVTAQVMAGVALARSGVKLRGSLVINEVAEEEVGGELGAAYCVEHGEINPDWVIVGEQTLNKVALGEKGGAAQIIKVYGRTSHSALPWEGANAIEGIAEIIVALRRELWPALEERGHQYFHHSSAAVTLMEGGVKINVVPDYAECTVDRRLVPGETTEQVHREIKEIAERAIAAIPGLRVEVVPTFMGREAMLSEPDSKLVRAMVGANSYLGLSEQLTGFSMATDGRHFAVKGYPTIIYGPGDPKLAHIPNEWVGVDEVLEATKAYALTALSLLSDA